MNFIYLIVVAILILGQAHIIMGIERIHTALNKPIPKIETCPAPPTNTPKPTKYTVFSYHKTKPNKTAILEKPKAGWSCAVSPDLTHWLGGRIYVEGVGVRRVNDLMHTYNKNTVDLYAGTAKEARTFGRKTLNVIYLGQ